MKKKVIVILLSVIILFIIFIAASIKYKNFSDERCDKNKGYIYIPGSGCVLREKTLE